MTTPNEWYATRITDTESQLRSIYRQINRTSLLRIIFFLALPTAVILLHDKPLWYPATGVVCTLIPFLSLVKYHNRLYDQKLRLETRLRINRSESKALHDDYSDFDGGDDFSDPQHPYTFDLDVFGRHSLFQMLNRCCTAAGRRLLATWLNQHLTDKDKIIQRQKSISDLARRTDFREAFRTEGMIHNTTDEDTEEIRHWVESHSLLLHSLWVRIALWAVPTINIVLLAGGLSGCWGMQWFGMMFLLFVIISFTMVKRATVIQEDYGRKLKRLGCYARLIDLAKSIVWTAPELRHITDTLNLGGKSPERALAELSRELNRLDLRNNQMLYVLLEGSIFFQLRQIVRIEHWKIRYGQHLMGWIHTVAQLDALCSLGTFAFNHPGYSFPTIADEPFRFEATDMGHPLIPENQCVKNDACIPFRPYFLIITGANMAGKSTYLRSVGTNFLLACLGCPVCCKSLTLYPASLVTSLRTSDSLSGHESYFFAELKRLKHIIDRLNCGEHLFIILDEILKGTNSADKQKGSFDLISQFMRLHANGIIATHDLLLASLAERFPGQIENSCFEADICGDKLSFSYRLRKGVAQNMNASFLMKKMGITPGENAAH